MLASPSPGMSLINEETTSSIRSTSGLTTVGRAPAASLAANSSEGRLLGLPLRTRPLPTLDRDVFGGTAMILTDNSRKTAAIEILKNRSRTEADSRVSLVLV